MKPKAILAQLSTAEKRQRLLGSLEDHRHLLRAAVESMTTGDLTHALSIATSVRVLVHETGMSKPLLKALRSEYLDLIVMVQPPPPPAAVAPGLTAVTYHLPISIQYSTSDRKIRLNPHYAKELNHSLTLGAWWARSFTNIPGVGAYSREQLVLDVANKEAAHVDVEISEKFKRILESQMFSIGFNDEKPSPMNLARLLIGTIGVEMLVFLDRHFPAQP